MNDPNGLVYLDGEYHLFFQYSPVSSDWSDIGWGHAVSRDLLQWEELPMALPATAEGMAFSGSAVVDHRNTAGFASGDTPALVAIFTNHAPTGRQSQHVAYSIDRGRSWRRYSGNPVLDVESKSFRDPKVSWHAESEHWIMVIVLASEHKVQFYASPNLLNWEYLSEFGPAGNIEGDWECPDLIRLPVDGNAAESRWLLKVDNTLGGSAGGSGGQYFIGHFDGRRFTCDEQSPTSTPLDYGSDFYAAMSWSDLPADADRQVWLGWMSNWLYAARVPTSPFRGIQSLPRSLHLARRDGRLMLVQRPTSELDARRADRQTLRDVAIGDGQPRRPVAALPDPFDLVLELKASADAVVTLVLEDPTGSVTSLTCDRAADELRFDRRRSAKRPFHESFPGCHVAPLHARDDVVRLRLVRDRCCLEVFAGDGEVVMSNLFFPDAAELSLRLSCDAGEAVVERLDCWALTPLAASAKPDQLQQEPEYQDGR